MKRIGLMMIFMSIARMSFAEISNCFKINQIHQDICLRCDEGYILDQIGGSCGQLELEGLNKSLVNCIQISNSGECMRCDCGYALQIELGVCMLASDSLIGCETFTGDDSCTRPKTEFMFLREDSNKSPSLSFARGTNCEIFDLIHGSCSQCHSGYKLDNENRCQGLAQRTFNDFYSYFSPDGELLSRSIYFIATAYGIYPKINNCDVYLIQANSSSPLQCEKCSSGKSLNTSKNLCLKQPFDSCQTVSDTDHSLCEECIENDSFYLSTDQNQQQICLPRSQLDPTSRCLSYFKFSPGCLQCTKGLISTFQGCTLLNQISVTKLFSQTQEYQQKYSFESSYLTHSLTDFGCDLWVSQGVCGSCKQQMILNNLGYCQFNDDKFCRVALATGGCFQCQLFMYYNEEQNKCVDITNNTFCQHSSGFENKCDKCQSSFLIDQHGQCIPLTQPYCISSGIKDKCEACVNLTFLTDNDKRCEALTSFLTCLLSDGITNTCLQCKRNYVLNEVGNCIFDQQMLEDYCIKRQHYFDENTNSCIQYTFLNNTFCYLFDQYANQCLQCKIGFYLTQGGCMNIDNCLVSDGVNNECFVEFVVLNTPTTGQQQLNNEDNDINNLNSLPSLCTICQIEKEAFIFKLSESKCLLYDQVFNEKILERCQMFYQQIKTQAPQGYCKDLFQPKNISIYETEACQSLLGGQCLISDLKQNRCVLCKYQYNLNQKTQTCELKTNIVIPFCEEMQEGICMKCRNLYFLEQNYCIQIHDPDCELSDGLRNQCQKCANGYMIDPKLQGYLQLAITCSQFMIISRNSTDNATANNNIHFGVSRISMVTRKMKNQDQCNKLLRIFLLWILIKPGILIGFLQNCKRHSTLNLKCVECNEGFFLNQIHPQQVSCLRIDIENCIDMASEGNRCSKCREGYTIQDQTGFCVFNPQCLKFNKVCLSCSEESLLENGKCLEIAHCQEQNKETCLRCLPGFWLQFIDGDNWDADYQQGMAVSKDSQGDKRSANKMKINYDKQLQIDNYQTILYEESQSIFPSTPFKQECVRILHCNHSDGISQFCSKCDLGYSLVNQVCLRNNNFQRFLNCQDFRGDQENECARCFNLFFISSSFCTEIDEKNCSLSDGVINSCQLCTFEGFRLTQDGECQAIDHCVVSNGKDWCVLCESGYIVDDQGECVEIKKKIDNCEIYTYFEVIMFDSTSRSYIQAQRQKQETFLDNENDINSQFMIKPYCIKCENRFWIDRKGFQQCLPLLLDFEGRYCELSDGISKNCSVCQQGYSLKLQFKDTTFQCASSKKNLRLMNLGCKLFNRYRQCQECFDNFFLGTHDLCYARRASREKCRKLHPSKDECLGCRNGYKMKEIVESNMKRMICIELQGKDIVRNCEKYAVNTNKCVKCGSRSQQKDLAEFILNEKENLCEDVLYFMCRKFDSQGSCLEGYIPNCQVYNENPRNSGCLVCENGFYLDESKKTCIFHEIIPNCLIYSQLIKSTCETCNHLFFLEHPSKCQQRFSSSLNCKVLERDADRCLTCENRFAVSVDNGNCIENQSIPNCYSLLFNPQTNQTTCHKCKESFYLSTDTQVQQQCLLRIIDNNCKSLNPFNECIECKENYLLTDTHDCIQMNSPCQIRNCLEYDGQSNSQEMLCAKCLSNYFLDSNSKKCLPLDPESNFQIEKDNHQNLEEEASPGLKQFMKVFGSILVGISLAVLVLLGCKTIQQNQNSKLNLKKDKISLDAINLSNTAIQLEQPMKSIELSYHNNKEESIFDNI